MKYLKIKQFLFGHSKKIEHSAYEDHLVNTDNFDDPILKAKEKFKNHQSNRLIKCRYENKNNTFYFSNITYSEIERI